MNEYFCNYEQALALKELGFDEPCWCYFVNDVFFDSMFPKDYDYFEHMNKKMEYTLAPLKSQVFKWFRDKHHLYHMVHHFEHKKGTSKEFLSEISGKLLLGNDDVSKFSNHKTHEEAESACIDNLIEILKEE
jgi:hypothetical protein